ncbi:MAG TPA: CHC2 zinc finger domain-containing protein [Pseudoxanthomonas sp.]
MSAAPRIDVDALKSRIDLEDVIRACGVDLKKHGSELAALCPFHHEKTPSFKVTPKTQLYYCAGCGAGGDSVQFLRDYHGVGFKDAARRLAELAGGTIEPANDNAPRQRAPRKEPEPPKWIKATAPDSAPPCPESLRILRGGEWTDTPVVAVWAYHNRAGELLGYTCRIEFEKPDGSRGKDVIPVTWQTSTDTGESKWRQGALEEPRPLYGADLLDAHPDANIVLVEGEKACDAARRMLAGKPFLVLTWPGGCKAVDKADWSALAGRKVVGWPDCDSQRDREGNLRPYIEQPGMAAMLRIAELLAEHGTDMRIVAVPEPDTIADGWDLADGEAEGWDGERVLAELRAALATADELRERHEAPPLAEELPPTENDNEPPPAPEKPARKRAEKPKRPPPPRAEDLDDNMPVRALGYNYGRYYYLSGKQRQVHEYTAQSHGPTGLMQLAPLSFWQDKFAYGDKMKGEHWQAAVDALMRRCERAGIFDTDIIRGRGCWIDENRLVLNLGNRVLVDGETTTVDELSRDDGYIYEAGARLDGPGSEPLSVEEARRVLEIAKRFNWEMQASAALLAGWIVLAPLCGALPWRPHIWLTGGTGTGKTTILERFIVPLLAGTELQVQGNSTEAGIRQTLRADARPVVFDESEQNDEGEERRIQNVLALVRQSSSESQSRTLKGTTSGKHLEFHIRSMFCLASIQVGIKRQADQTRISVLGLYGTSQIPADQVDAHHSKWLDTEQMLADLRDEPEFGSRLMARSVAMFDVIRQNMRTLVRVAAREFKSQRLGDQYGTLLAGTATLMYDHPITEEGALRFIRLFDWSVYLEAAREDESADALTAMMQIEVKCELERGSVAMTAGELVAIVVDQQMRDGISPTDAKGHLGRLGLKVKRGIVGQDAGLLVANKSEKLARAMRGAPWAADWRSYLRRLPGAKPHNVPITFAPGYGARATFIPIEQVLRGDQGD